MKSCVMGDDDEPTTCCCCWKNDDGCCLKMEGCFDNSAEDGGRDNSGDDTVKAVALFAVAVRPIRRRVNLMVMLLLPQHGRIYRGHLLIIPFWEFVSMS